MADATRSEFAEEAKKEYDKKMGLKAKEAEWEARLQHGAVEQALELQRSKDKELQRSKDKKKSSKKSKHKVRAADRLACAHAAGAGDSCF